MGQIATAVLDLDFAETWFRTQTEFGWSDDLMSGPHQAANIMGWSASACALLGDQIPGGIRGEGETNHAIVLAILNYTDAPLACAVDGGAAYYGSIEFAPQTMLPDAGSKMLLPVGPACTIPPGRPADPSVPGQTAKVGVGVFISKFAGAFLGIGYGTGFAMTITGDALGDKVPLYLAVQHALHNPKNHYASIALATDLRPYGTVRGFYDQACDDVRNRNASAAFTPRAGDAGRAFSASAATAGVGNQYMPDSQMPLFSGFYHIQAMLAVTN